MGNKNLHNAKVAKNDEFYTQYPDIQKEINAYLEYDPNVFKDKSILLPCDDPEWSNFTKFFAQNFEKFGLKKLISTCYINTKQIYLNNDSLQNFNSHGKILVITKENLNSKWEYLKGDGDFRSSEIKALRDESDFIITNPPFSLFREFVSWIFETDKKFLIIGNMNAITYKEIFPLFKNNLLWSGRTEWSGGLWFETTNNDDVDKIIDNKKMKHVSAFWLTNIDHGRRNQPLQLMSMADNIKFNKKLKGKEYQKYDNYDAIEVPYTDAIPSDYDGVMGVPITFLDKYCPEQFEILGSDAYEGTPPNKKYSASKIKVVNGIRSESKTGTMGCVIREDKFGQGTYFDVGYPVRAVYKRIFIRKIK